MRLIMKITIFFSLLWIKPICLFQFRKTSEIINHRHTVGLLGRVISSSLLPTQDNTTQKDEDKHPCLKRDSNPRSSVRALKAADLRPHGHLNDIIDDQWRYSPDRASVTGFMIVYSTMWGYQLHDRPVIDTLIQPSEASSSNYQKLSWRSRETRVRNGR
jgi:hypothetical protein